MVWKSSSAKCLEAEKTTACVWIQAKVQNMKPRFLSNFKIKYKCQMDFSIVASGPPKISCSRVMKIEEFQGVDIFKIIKT